MRGNRGGKRICPKCLGKVPKGEQDCPHCGYHLAAPGEASDAPAWADHGNDLIPYRDPVVASKRTSGSLGYQSSPDRPPVYGYVIIGVLLAAVVLALVMASGTDTPKSRPAQDRADVYRRHFETFCANAGKAKDKTKIDGLDGQPAYNPAKIDHWMQFVSRGDTRSLLHVGKTIDPSDEVTRVDLIGCYSPGKIQTLPTTCSYVDPDLAPLPDQPVPTYQVHLEREQGTLDVYEAHTGKLLRTDPILGASGPCPKEAAADRTPPRMPVDETFEWNAWSLKHLAGGKLH